MANASPIAAEALRRIARLYAVEAEIRYALSCWTELTRYRDDGRIEIDNNAAERAADRGLGSQELALRRL